MERIGFVYDDLMLSHEPPPWHPEKKERLQRIVEAVKDSGLWDLLVHIQPGKADWGHISLVHTPAYQEMIQSFREGCLDPDTYASANSLDAALCAAGAVIEAVERIRKEEISRAFCAVRPPGHHAEADSAKGFCLFNNAAIGARYAQKAGFEKVFIVDFDAHHGNGIQHIFEEDDSVFYFSTHQYPYYPETGRDMERGKGKGEGYTYNVQILKGSGNKDYLQVYQDILPGLVRRFAPQMVLVSAGYDIHAKDPHADIRVTAEGIRGIVSAILDASPCPVIFVLEGGYDLGALAESVVITLEEMLRSRE